MNYSKKHVKLLCYRFFRYEKGFKNYKGRKNLYLSLVDEIEEAAHYGAFHNFKLKKELRTEHFTKLNSRRRIYESIQNES